MKLPRNLSGRELAKSLCREWQYQQMHQTGSHIILETDEPFRQRITVPNHKALGIGTLNSILRAVSNHKQVSRDTLMAKL